MHEIRRYIPWIKPCIQDSEITPNTVEEWVNSRSGLNHIDFGIQAQSTDWRSVFLAIGRYPRIVGVAMTRTAISEQDLRYISLLGNTLLNLDLNYITLEPQMKFLGALSQLRELSLSTTSEDSEGTGIASQNLYFRNLRHLEKLDLRDNRLSDIEGILELPHLTRLIIAQNRIHSVGIRRIFLLESLEIIDLENNGVGEEGVWYLAKLFRLKSLTLNQNHLSDEMALHLQRTPLLECVNLKAEQVRSRFDGHYMHKLIVLSRLKECHKNYLPKRLQKTFERALPNCDMKEYWHYTN